MGAQLQRGLFDVYQKEGQIYLAVAKGQLDKPFLLATHVDRGTGSLSLFAGLRRGIRICEFHRRGDMVYLLQRSSYFSTASGSDWEQIVDQSYAPTVLDSAKVEAVRPDGAVLIAIQGWLTSDLTNIGVQVELKPGKSSRPSDRSRSFVESVRVFPDNINFSALLTFAISDDAHVPLLPDGDGRFLPVGVSYTLARLPAVPMAPRLADDRIGLNEVVRKAPGKVLDPYVRYVHRWRMQPGQPLTFYLDPSIPADYRPFVIAAVKAWDRALTAAGWEHMITTKPLPPGADPGDLRYPTLRWSTQISAGIEGVASTVVDPRTGELLGCTVVLDGDHLLEDRLLRLMLILQGRLRPEQPLPLEYVGQIIKSTTLHEVGHALGLPHNFVATQATAADKLGDAEWVKAHRIASSVMDYPAVNLPYSLKVPLGSEFPIYDQDIGPTDIWAIRYAYDRDDQLAQELARTAAQQGHRYAQHTWRSDEDDPDPTVARFDLGGNSLDWMRRRMQLLRELLAALPGPLPGDNGRTYELTRMVESLLYHYSVSARLATRYLGGYQSFFDHAGDPAQRPTALAIPKAQQREALQLLAEAVFREDALRLPAPLQQRMGANRFSSSSVDPVLDALTWVPQATLEALTSAKLMARLRVAEVRFGATSTVTLVELFDALDSMIFGAAGPPASSLRRELQRDYADRLITLVLDPPRELPKDARALAREHLTLLRQRLTGGRGGDIASAAHRRDLLTRIGRVLDAQVVERSP